MSYFSIDVESDGSIPGDFSMVCFGAVLIDKEGKLDKTFYGELHPISEEYNPEALAISGFTREEHEKFPAPVQTMKEFKEWVLVTNTNGHPKFISDNNGYDWLFIHWYMEHFLGERSNPFGWSSRNLNDVYHGLVKNMHKSFKHLRRTKHTHNPVNDAKGNAEAFLAMAKQHNLVL